jgi:anaerobic selenocysteine-containing dehydrogenase/Fe-S-cluster-containing dehydrogenase component
MSDGMKRRDFLKVVGVSGAGAGLVGCSTDQVERLIPYVTPPEEITPGLATWYSTVCGDCSAGCGVWVKTMEGRAIKLEGNPNHPVSGGALCSRGHSSLQALYDPDRIEGPLRRDGDGFEPISWEEAERLLADGIRAAGSNVRLIAGRTGPSMTRLQEDLAAAVGGRRVEYEALDHAALREAARMAFGTTTVPTFDFEAAGIVFSFGADFLETWLSPVEHGRGFARMSGVDAELRKGRTVFVGPRLSLTGQNADDWVPVPAGAEAVVALGMAHAIVREEGGSAGPYAQLLQAYGPESVAEAAGIEASTIREMARRFVQDGPGLAVGPGMAAQGRNATATNLAVLVLNAVAGSVGVTVHPGREHRSAPAAGYSGLAGAVREMEAGQIQAVILHGTNPAYTLPPGSGFADALGQVGFKVAITPWMDETAELADLVLPSRHFLESWGDQNPRPGLWSVQQPVMRPVPHFDTKDAGDILLGLARALDANLGAETFHDYVRSHWQELHARAGSPDGAFQSFWRRVLREGMAQVPEAAPATPGLRAPDRALTFDPPSLDGEGLALVVHPSSRFFDGRGANRPWLQELPDPVSKIAWHSWVEIHPDTARAIGVRKGDIVVVRSPHGEVEVPVWTYPGIRTDTAALAMGAGHTSYGRYAKGKGVNAMSLLPTEVENPSGALVHLATRVEIEPTGRRRRLATIEGSADQRDRPIAPAVAVETLRRGELHHEDREIQELQAVGGFAPVPTRGAPEDFPLPGARYGEYDPETNARWAMAIDLDKCTGCSACVTACQSENNVAWVGEDQLAMGRDLHWIRLERYYEEVDQSRPGPVDIRFLPMLCQHCGNAPCEPVCPVYAAYHTPDGLNAQIYNRCVGTRYCANNCPYKVRVFNWHRFSDVPEPLNWAYNPDVTVRGEGVMEKCSFCVQRIRQSENRAALEGRDLREGEVVPACQQSCPAEAIVFGNIRDPESRVAQVAHDDRTYRVLDVLINTQPAVNYLRKVTFHPVKDIHV